MKLLQVLIVLLLYNNFGFYYGAFNVVPRVRVTLVQLNNTDLKQPWTATPRTANKGEGEWG